MKHREGGFVRPGELTYVGERGPELVTFTTPGYLLPNITSTGSTGWVVWKSPKRRRKAA